MMIESTVMRYVYGPDGMTELTFNKKALDHWAKSLHKSTIIWYNGFSEISLNPLLDIIEVSTSRDVGHRKEEWRSRIAENEKNWVKVLSTCIPLFDAENHTAKIVNIYTGKLSNKHVHTGKCIEIGSKQVKKFHLTLHEGVYDPLSKQGKTKSILQKSVRVNDEEIIDTSLICSIVIAMQLTNAAMTAENVFKHELAPIATSIFNDDGDLTPAKSKTVLKRTLESQMSSRTMD